MKPFFPAAILVLAYCLAAAPLCLAQTDSSSFDLSIDELKNLKATEKASDLQKELNQEVSVSSQKPIPTRETPAIVSLITAAEIKAMGARNLLEVLENVPGFNVGTDVDMLMSVGVRGNWAAEGKTLLLIDGQEMNDLLYQTITLGHHYPVENIQRIEISRGPGSSVYGGAAEYAVINIISKNGAALNGLAFGGNLGATRRGLTASNYFLSGGKKIAGWDISASVFGGRNRISDSDAYTEYYVDEDSASGDPYILENRWDLMEKSRQNPLFVNVGVQKGGFKFRGIYDGYKQTTHNYLIGFGHISGEVSYQIKAGDKFSFLPKASYTNQKPWEYETLDPEVPYHYEVRGERLKASMLGSYRHSRKANLSFGIEAFEDRATDLLFGMDLNDALWPQARTSFYNLAGFAQAYFLSRFANITLGARYDRHSAYGQAFVPRLAFTKKWENFHFKLLASKAFRAPSLENINFNPDIKAEKSAVAELELGYQFTPQSLLALNLFHTKTRNPIVYASTLGADGEYSEAYVNFDFTGTSGLEAVYKYKGGNFSADLNYAYYRALKDVPVALLLSDQNPRSFLAMPRHKIGFLLGYELAPGLRANAGGALASARQTSWKTDLEGNRLEETLPAYFLLNINLNYDDCLAKGLSVCLGIRDVANQKPFIGTASHNDYPPIPGKSREYFLKLRYELPFGAQTKTP